MNLYTRDNKLYQLGQYLPGMNKTNELYIYEWMDAGRSVSEI